MIEPSEPDTAESDVLDRIIKAGPAGAVSVSFVATIVVFGIWFAFYLFVFLPRVSP
ncbi:membrane protein [Bradyrhizobium sp. NAS80.1]|uniref:hypothetical protein n=1 Tax=Bradyrhizobium sp. NAS80.1 TaxID=1680159 RepID=UPI000967965A|nr:hypothetical protein [Bradyrhizobium sp. NAS80.1]OKO82285.1 membrane protein [Bradyrhizobium sp. NAS80.1]